MGIVVRAADAYVPILRSTLDRFGIPARFYFDSELDRHAVTRFLAGAVEAMLGGWDHAQTLAVLRLAPRFADSSTLDRFDFAVREQLPNAGLGALRAMAGEGDKLTRLLDALAGIEEWRSFSLAPKDWAERFRTLRNLFRPSVGRDFAAHAGVCGAARRPSSSSSTRPSTKPPGRSIRGAPWPSRISGAR